MADHRRDQLKENLYVKKVLLVTMLFLCMLLVSCDRGKTEHVVISIGESAVHTKKDLQSAVDIVLKRFKEYRSCELTQLWYEGDIGLSENPDIIVLRSTFATGPNAEDAGFNPNANYSWSWEITKTEAEKWELTNYGQG